MYKKNLKKTGTELSKSLVVQQTIYWLIKYTSTSCEGRQEHAIVMYELRVSGGNHIVCLKGETRKKN